MLNTDMIQSCLLMGGELTDYLTSGIKKWIFSSLPLINLTAALVHGENALFSVAYRFSLFQN